MNRELTDIIYKAIESIDKKSGEDIVVLDISKISSICEFFVITSVTSSRQVKAIADEIEDGLINLDIALLQKEGYEAGRWVLLDYGDIIFHIFHEEERKFYNLESVWRDADRVNVL